MTLARRRARSERGAHGFPLTVRCGLASRALDPQSARVLLPARWLSPELVYPLLHLWLTALALALASGYGWASLSSGQRMYVYRASTLGASGARGSCWRGRAPCPASLASSANYVRFSCATDASVWLACCFGRFLSDQCSNACQSFSVDYCRSGKPKFTTVVHGGACFGSVQTLKKAIVKRAVMHLQKARIRFTMQVKHSYCKQLQHFD